METRGSDIKIESEYIKTIVSDLENFPSFAVINPPTNRQINTADHQAEAVRFDVEDGTVIFFPRGYIIYQGEVTILKGEYESGDEVCRGCLLLSEPDDETRKAVFYDLGVFSKDTNLDLKYLFV